MMLVFGKVGVVTEIDLENLHEFVRDNGDVGFVDSTGKVHKLSNGAPNTWELALKAARFQYARSGVQQSGFSEAHGHDDDEAGGCDANRVTTHKLSTWRVQTRKK
jgi:hypothetical protein